jgi:hypothetical protein
VLVILTLTITQQGEKPMAQQNEEHLEVISKNKAKAYEEQKEMREECSAFITAYPRYSPRCNLVSRYRPIAAGRQHQFPAPALGFFSEFNF